jgi:rRNA-processing protein FCF1
MSDQNGVLVRVVVTDTNILINLIHVGLIDLLGKLPPYSFVIPEEVVREITDRDQANAVQAAVASRLLQVVQLTDPGELTVYAELIQILAIGEAACLSLAQCRNWLIASDEKKQLCDWDQGVSSTRPESLPTQSRVVSSRLKKLTKLKRCLSNAVLL